MVQVGCDKHYLIQRAEMLMEIEHMFKFAREEMFVSMAIKRMTHAN